MRRNRERLRDPRLWVVLALVFGVAFVTTDRLRAQKVETQPATHERAIPVRAQIASPGDTGPFRATGTLTSRHQVTLSFAVSGVVSRVASSEGDPVEAGSLLASLDPVPFHAAQEQAAARVDFLRTRLDRSRNLAREGAIAKEELDADEADLESAENQLRALKWNHERSRLTAPFGGRILKESLEVGQVVSPGVPVFELIDTENLELRVAVPAEVFAELDLDAAATVYLPDRREQSVRAELAHLPVSGDPRSGSIPLRLYVDNSSQVLLPGTVVWAELPRSAGDERVNVPLSALRVDDGGASVFVIENNHATRIPVKTGSIREERASILSGLRDGQLYVIEPPDRLRDGDAVQVVEG